LSIVAALFALLALAACAPAISPAADIAPEPPTVARPVPTPTAPLLVPPDDPAESSPPADRRPVAVTILHTNDTMGEIEPCG